MPLPSHGKRQSPGGPGSSATAITLPSSDTTYYSGMKNMRPSGAK